MYSVRKDTVFICFLILITSNKIQSKKFPYPVKLRSGDHNFLSIFNKFSPLEVRNERMRADSFENLPFRRSMSRGHRINKFDKNDLMYLKKPKNKTVGKINKINKLFDENDMLYLTYPKNRVDRTINEMIKDIVDLKLIKEKKRNHVKIRDPFLSDRKRYVYMTPKSVFYFSDLVL